MKTILIPIFVFLATWSGVLHAAAPVNTVPGAQTVNEDTALSITGVSASDVDNNLAAVQTSVSNGKLTVSLAGGATIIAGANNSGTLTLSGTQAQINAALATLSYQGNANFNGADVLTVVSTDSAGLPLSDTDTVAITVNAVNDAPTSTNDSVTTLEDATSTLSVSDFGSYSDVESSPMTVVRISALESAGSLEYFNGSSWVGVLLNQVISAIDVASGLLRFVPDANANGSPYATFSFQVSDGSDFSGAYILTINVTSVNDAPVNTVPGVQTVNEDTALSISGVSVNDVDGNLAAVQTSVVNGNLTVSLVGGATIISGANNSGTLTLSGTQAQINAALATLSYQGNANFNGADVLTMVSTDSAGLPLSDTDTVAITVNAVNDAPTSTNDSVTTLEDATYTLSVSDFGSYNDLEGNPLAAVRISTLESAGSLEYYNGSSWVGVSLNQVISAVNVIAGNLRFIPDVNANGSAYATVSFRVSDGIDFSVGAYTLTVNVTAVNDAPVNTVPGAQTVNEDTALPISGVSVNDVDGNLAAVQTSVVNGNLTVSLVGGAAIIAGANNSGMLTLSGTQAQINAALATLSYQGNANFNGPDVLTVVSTDSAGAPLSDTDTVAITVNAVNDAPVLADTALSLTVAEDAGVPVGAVGSLVSGFTGGLSDADSGAIKGIAITGIDETNGTFYYSTNNGTNWTTVGSVSSASSLLLAANASTRLYFAPVANYNGTVAAALTIRGWDQTSGAAGSKVSTISMGGSTAFSSATDVIAVTIIDVNSAPVTSFDVFSTNEDTVLTVTLSRSILRNDSDFHEGDPLENNTPMTVMLSDPPAHASAFTLNPNGSFTYTPRPDFHGTDSFTYRALDSLGAMSDPETVLVAVRAVNDTPVAQSQSITTLEDVPVAVRLRGADVDAAVQYDLGEWIGFVPPAVNQAPNDAALIYTIVTGPQHGTLTGTGTQHVYTPALNYHGTDSFTFTVSDGLATSAPAMVSITIKADADGDSLPDMMEMAFFSTLVFTGNDDPDGDGQDNAFELLADTNPNDANSFLSMEMASPIADGGVFRLNHVRPGVLYQLQASTTLDNWDTISSVTYEVEGPGAMYDNRSSPRPDRCFYRVTLGTPVVP